MLCAALTLPFATARADEPLQPERLGQVATLPATYPDHWLLVHDLTWFKFLESRILLVDPLAGTVATQVKGQITASMGLGYERSRKRGEHYVPETFWSRGIRGGERTDTVTIYDHATLTVQGEVVIPPKRLSGMPKPISTGITPDERFLFVYNFTPSQSVSVVDMEQRRFVGEVEINGCGFIIPTGQRSFGSLCSNGTLRTTHLAEDGTYEASETSPKFFDADADPLFESAALTGKLAIFPTFQGRIVTLDVSDETPRIAEPWWLTTTDERSWRPAGARPVVADAAGAVYVLMQPDGAEGTHKNGGPEVWVLDPMTKERTGRIVLKNWGIALGTTGAGDHRLLIVTNADLALDVYRIPAGEYVHTLGIVAEAPFLTYGVN
jgi:methylamine dehydrogenase heavy chain